MHRLLLLWAAHNEDVYRERRARRISRQYISEEIKEMPDDSFREKFGLNKETFRSLCRDLHAHTALRGTKEIPLELKVLCTLNFLSTGSYQRIVGVTQQFSQRSASRAIREVVEVLSSDYMLGKYITFPQTPQERSQIRQDFQRRFHLPSVIGCIDCTHVTIVKPDKDQHLYLNKKGYHSLNIQMICDQNLKILNVDAENGGATLDSLIWASSELEAYMRELNQNGELTWLLGDSKYPQRAWLMTPILNAAPGTQEELYISRHTMAMKCIEQCFGLLKARWRCLLKQKTLHYHPQVASDIVLACCVLHNIALKAGLPPPSDVVGENDDGGDDDDVTIVTASSTEEDLMLGKATLDCLISSLAYFNK